MGPAQSQGPGERGQGKYIHTSHTLGVQGWTPEAMSEESGHLELIQSSPWSGTLGVWVWPHPFWARPQQSQPSLLCLNHQFPFQSRCRGLSPSGRRRWWRSCPTRRPTIPVRGCGGPGGGGGGGLDTTPLGPQSLGSTPVDNRDEPCGPPAPAAGPCERAPPRCGCQPGPLGKRWLRPHPVICSQFWPCLQPHPLLSPLRPSLVPWPQLHSSVQFSRSVVSDCSRPHGLQHARPPCPSPTPGACSNSCPSSR